MALANIILKNVLQTQMPPSMEAGCCALRNSRRGQRAPPLPVKAPKATSDALVLLRCHQWEIFKFFPLLTSQRFYSKSQKIKSRSELRDPPIQPKPHLSLNHGFPAYQTV